MADAEASGMMVDNLGPFIEVPAPSESLTVHQEKPNEVEQKAQPPKASAFGTYAAGNPAHVANQGGDHKIPPKDPKGTGPEVQQLESVSQDYRPPSFFLPCQPS